MDLFVVPTIGFDLLYCLVIVRLDRRDLVWINVTLNPTAEWIARPLTEAFPWNKAPQYLVRDSRLEQIRKSWPILMPKKTRPLTEAAFRTSSSSGLPPTIAPPIWPAVVITTAPRIWSAIVITTIVGPSALRAPTTVRTAPPDKSRRAIGSRSSAGRSLNRRENL